MRAGNRREERFMTMQSRNRRYVIGFVLLSIALVLLLLLNLMTGSVMIPAGEIVQILRSGDNTSKAGVIVSQIRMPRMLAAMLLGGALAVSGFLLQTYFQNPIAGPFVLGISSGAKLVVACVMIGCLTAGIQVSSGMMVIAAFAGSLAAMGVVLLAGIRVKSMSVLVICGVMIGYICSAVTEFLVTFAEDSNIVNLHNWSMGSFSGIEWHEVVIIAILVVAGMICVMMLAKPMSAFQMGEMYAANSGVNIRRFRICLILFSSMLSACVTAFAGPVSFVGIAVPQLIKRLFSTSRPLIVIPGCFLGGCVFCLLCDLIARTMFAPTELSISSVTAVFGAPVVIWMLLKRRGRA